jgi:hypothetical protein
VGDEVLSTCAQAKLAECWVGVVEVKVCDCVSRCVCGDLRRGWKGSVLRAKRVGDEVLSTCAQAQLVGCCLGWLVLFGLSDWLVVCG